MQPPRDRSRLALANELVERLDQHDCRCTARTDAGQNTERHPDGSRDQDAHAGAGAERERDGEDHDDDGPHIGEGRGAAITSAVRRACRCHRVPSLACGVTCADCLVREHDFGAGRE